MLDKGEKMSQFKVKLDKMESALGEIDQLMPVLQQVAAGITLVRIQMRMEIRQKERISSRLMMLARELEGEHNRMRQMQETGHSIVELYREKEQWLVDAALEFLKRLGIGNLDGRSGVFDGEGGYGGDQGDLIHNKSGKKTLFFRVGADEELFDFVRQYDAYRDYSDEEIINLYGRINEEGCGYVAFVNTVMTKYEGREDAFMRDFGFPLYDENGEFNFNRLLIDFYAHTDDQYFLNRESGADALVNDKLLSYEGKADEFRERYGVDLYENDGDTWSDEARQAILDEYEGQDTASFESGGMTILSMENRISEYISTKEGVNCENKKVFPERPFSKNEIDGYINKGDVINILAADFNLYREDGQLAQGGVGGHWMSITGTTEDGRYIVSSWGEKYYIDPSELDGNFCFLINEITVNP